MTPLISVIIPLYNREELVKETIESVINQSYTNWECIIVDDDSTDTSYEVVKAYDNQDDRVKLFKRGCLPKGAPTCRNEGVKYAKGEYIIFLDSDDILLHDSLQLRVNYFKANSENSFIVFPSGFFKEKVDDTRRVWNLLNRKKYSDLYRFFNRDTPWSITGPTWKKEAFLQLGGFQEGISSGQDWELHVRAITSSLKYKKSPDEIRYIDNYVRRGGHNSISTGFYTSSQTKSRIEMYHRVMQEISFSTLEEDERKSIIQHFTRFTYQTNQNLSAKISFDGIRILSTYCKISLGLKLLILTKTYTFLNKLFLTNKGIDFLFYRIYGFSDILKPKDITKGTQKPFKNA